MGSWRSDVLYEVDKMERRMKKFGIMIAMVMVAASAVQAQLAIWENDNLITATNSTPVDFIATDMSAGVLKTGPGFAVPGFNGVGGESWDNALDVYLSDNTNVTTLATAIAKNRYYSFTTTPIFGKQADYTNVAARVTLNDTGTGASVRIVLMSSLTGFADGDEIGSFVASTPAGDITDNGLINMDISGVAELQDQPSEVEFRLYVVLNGGSYSRVALGHIFFADAAADVQVDGTTEDATSLPVVTLAQWDLDGLAANSSSAAVDLVHSNISSTALVAQPGGFETSIGWSHALGGLADWHLGGSLVWTLDNKPNNYFTITLTPDAGTKVGYDRLFTRFSVNTGSGTANVTFHLLSDQTGFTTNNVLGTFNVSNNVPDYAPTGYTYEFDLSEVVELQNLTEPTEFRIYATATSGNRMAIGKAFGADGGADDLRVYGSIEALPYTPATIVSWSSVSASVMKLVIDAPADPAFYYPKGNTDLMSGTWAGVAHSDSAAGPFVVTNLTYSTAEGDNEVIYVETPDAMKFFGVGEE